MRTAVVLITLGLAVLAAGNSRSNAPSLTSIEQYPEVAALLRSTNLVTYSNVCAGTILNNRSILTSARCVYTDTPNRWRFRVGSTLWNSGGIVHTVNQILLHDFDEWSMMNDVAILRTSSNIAFGSAVQQGRFAGANYVIADNQAVNTAGWGHVSFPLIYPGDFSELHHMQVWTVNIDVCRRPYSSDGFYIQHFMICSGFANIIDSTVPRNKCFGEPGAPLYHNGVVVGIRSFGLNCINDASVPSVSTRVSSFINWITSNA